MALTGHPPPTILSRCLGPPERSLYSTVSRACIQSMCCGDEYLGTYKSTCRGGGTCPCIQTRLWPFPLPRTGPSGRMDAWLLHDALLRKCQGRRCDIAAAISSTVATTTTGSKNRIRHSAAFPSQSGHGTLPPRQVPLRGDRAQGTGTRVRASVRRQAASRAVRCARKGCPGLAPRPAVSSGQPAIHASVLPSPALFLFSSGPSAVRTPSVKSQCDCLTLPLFAPSRCMTNRRRCPWRGFVFALLAGGSPP